MTNPVALPGNRNYRSGVAFRRPSWSTSLNQNKTNMNTPYKNVGEASTYTAFLTGGDGHDKASLFRRTRHSYEPADLPVLDDKQWQALICLVGAAPALLQQLREAVQYLGGEEPSDDHDREVWHSILHYSRMAIARALNHPGEDSTPPPDPAEATRARFRAAAARSLDAIKHCGDRMNSKEMLADHALRNTLPRDWDVQDMPRVICADKRINHSIEQQ